MISKALKGIMHIKCSEKGQPLHNKIWQRYKKDKENKAHSFFNWENVMIQPNLF